MKLQLVVAILTCVCTSSVMARLPYKLTFEAETWLSQPKGHVERNISLGDSGLDLEAAQVIDLGLSFEHRWRYLPNIRVESSNIKFDGTGSLSTNYLGQDFDDSTESELDLNHKTLIGFWNLPIKSKYFGARIGIAGRQFSGRTETKSVDETKKGSEDLNFVMPAVYANVYIKLKKFPIYFKYNTLYLKYGDNSMIESKYEFLYPIRYRRFTWEIKGGYKKLELITDKDFADYAMDLKADGLFMGTSFQIKF